MLIGLCAQKQNGKDTMADYLCHKYKFIKLSFASPLKDACKILFGFTEAQVNGSEKEIIDEKWGVSPRTVLQFVGTDLFRDQMKTIIPGIGDNFWALCLKNSIDKIVKSTPDARIVISDVRFPNEVKMIQQLGGLIVKITRSSSIRQSSEPAVESKSSLERKIDDIKGNSSIENNTTRQHVSEKMIDTIKGDVLIENNGTILQFYEKIDKYMDQFISVHA